MRKIIFILALFVPLFSHADMTCSANGCNGIPEYIVSYPSGTVSIFPHGSTPNALTGEVDCTPVDSGRVIKLSTSTGQDKMVSILISAMTAKKSVFIRTQNNTSDCEVQYIRYHEDN